MLSINLNMITLGGVTISPQLTSGTQPTPTPQPTFPTAQSKLQIPWQDLQGQAHSMAFLTWHARLSKFYGRDHEMDELLKWATSPPAISVRFLTGEGGMGKSRLGAEIAQKLQSQEWEAGFVHLGRPQTFPLGQKGTLMVVDYPEEHRNALVELLQDLSALGQPDTPLRLLLLSRQQMPSWEPLIETSRAHALVEMRPINIGALDDEAAWNVFDSTQQQVGEKTETSYTPVSQEALFAWLTEYPEHRHPLFLVAAALRSVEEPQATDITYRGSDLINDITKREVINLQKIAEAQGLPDPNTITRLVAMAAIADPLNVEPLNSKLELLGLPPTHDLKTVLERASLGNAATVIAPKPDIVAAVFCVQVFSQNPSTAGSLIWAALEQDIEGGFARIGRLIYDTERMLPTEGFTV